MEVSELALWIARLGVLVLMYVFLLALVLALRADARAASGVSERRATVEPEILPTARNLVHGLRVTAGASLANGREFPFFSPLVIGRDPGCDIAIANRFVSSHHARISLTNGRWVVEDLGSTNGTLFNGIPLDRLQPLASGDTLVVGDTEFEVM